MRKKIDEFIQLSGELFEDVQLNRIFNDSKTFVDSSPKYDIDEIIQHYHKEKKSENFSLFNFVNKNFEIPHNKNSNIELPENRSITEHITMLWDFLERKPEQNISEYNSLISLPNNYIVPGGRFREIYYWDTYFTIIGLLLDNKIKLVENILNNFAFLINQYGHIPNGNRVYYTSRSQPPFFASMVNIVCKFKNDSYFALNYLTQIEMEYSFWMKHEIENLSMTSANCRVVNIGANLLNRFFDNSDIPREESYFEDVESATNIIAENKSIFYRNLRAACESGWDFSSRWFQDGKSLQTCVTTEIIPVDLNSLLYFYEKYLYDLYKLKTDENKTKIYLEKSEQRKTNINQILWNQNQNFYNDLNWKQEQFTNIQSLAALYPLFFNIAEIKQAEEVANLIELKFLEPGGVNTTTNYTGQQWDSPNGWAPLQWITIKGLRNYGFNSLADEIKSRWIKLNKSVFERTGKMFEKYNVVDISLHAGGGEYDLQDGFGWSNGIALALIKDIDVEVL